nr:hypothetical protein [Tanacetum cinerariifolium]
RQPDGGSRATVVAHAQAEFRFPAQPDVACVAGRAGLRHVRSRPASAAIRRPSDLADQRSGRPELHQPAGRSAAHCAVCGDELLQRRPGRHAHRA